MTTSLTPPVVGDTIDLEIISMAHGGLGVARRDGCVIFVHGGFPGDRVRAQITKAKKRFAHAEVSVVLTPSPLRVSQSCPAAAQGAGCCDFSELDPAAELGIKQEITREQLIRLGRSNLSVSGTELAPNRGWRTRTRLGVDEQGRAGVRRHGSNELITQVACTQVAPELLDGIVGPTARRFTPGAEVIAVLDSQGQRHVVESRKSGRGRRVERILRVIEGTPEVIETVSYGAAQAHDFIFDATAFWQAHRAAPQAYAERVTQLLTGVDLMSQQGAVWDLYSGVGLFIPAIAQAVPAAEIHAVDYSPAALSRRQPALADYRVTAHHATVERALSGLPAPAAVVLDPPRSGAGAAVVSRIAAARPQRVVHIGCDPATFARDIAVWAEHGYRLSTAEVINAFPGTHHFEVVGALDPMGVDKQE